MFWPSPLYQTGATKVIAMELLLLVAVLVLVGLAAQVWGADTRITNLDSNEGTKAVALG